MKYAKQRTNAQGQLLTREGKVDKRTLNGRPSENGGLPYQTYTVEFHPRNKRLPWQVWATEVATGKQTMMSAHRERHVAERNAERERIKQPDRRPSRKLRHRLGVLKD